MHHTRGCKSVVAHMPSRQAAARTMHQRNHTQQRFNQ